MSVISASQTGPDVGTSGNSGVQQPEQVDSPHSLLKALCGRIQTHFGGLNLLFTKVIALESALDKIRSDPAKVAIQDVLTVIRGLRGSKEEITKAYNAAYASAKLASQNSVPDPTHIQTCDAETTSLN